MKQSFIILLIFLASGCMNGVWEAASSGACLPQDLAAQAIIDLLEKPHNTETELRIYSNDGWEVLQRQQQKVLGYSDTLLRYVEFYEPFVDARGIKQVPVDDWPLDPGKGNQPQNIYTYQLNIRKDSCWISDRKAIPAAILSKQQYQLAEASHEVFRVATYEDKEDRYPAQVLYWCPDFGKILIEMAGESIMVVAFENKSIDRKVEPLRQELLKEIGADQ